MFHFLLYIKYEKHWILDFVYRVTHIKKFAMKISIYQPNNYKNYLRYLGEIYSNIYIDWFIKSRELLVYNI